MTNTTTPSTASQAPEVLTRQVAAWRAEVARLNDLIAHATGASQAPAVSIDTPEFRELLKKYHRSTTWDTKLIAHIDAKLAQAREEGRLDGYNKGWADASLTLIKAEARATAAEAKLEAIRQGVEGLIGRPDNWIKRDEVLLALLQPQSQAYREAEQRKRMQERFANRPKTPATADFDLPYASNSDGPDYSKADESGLPG